MDFTSHGTQPQTGGVEPAMKKGHDHNKWFRVIAVILLLSMVILLLALIAFISSFGTTSESSYVDSNQPQAVFLSNGQAYIGNIKAMNSRYLVMTNTYFLPAGDLSATNSGSSNATLAKLRCLLHVSNNQVIINHSQVTYWENVQNDTQVGQVIQSLEKQNSGSNQCSNPSTTSTSSTQAAGSTAATKP